MKVVSEADLRVALLSGAVVLFEAGVEREVSDEIGSVALQMGAKNVASLMTALVYAEFGSRFPKSGSSYYYSSMF